MNPLLLQAVVAEISSRLTQQEVLRVSFRVPSQYVLRFATAARDNLLVSVRPALPRLHLLPRPARFAEAPPDRFAALLDGELGGAVLEAIEKPAGDRVVEMAFRLPRRSAEAARRRLVIELFGRSANALLLDAAGTVIGFARDLRSAFRAPIAGKPYVPPRTPAAGPESEELVHDDAPGGPWAAVVCSARPLESYGEGDSMGRDEIRVEARPQPLLPGAASALPSSLETSFASPSEAAQVAFDLVERLRDFQDRSAHHRVLVRREAERLGHLEVRLLADLEGARDAARFRKWGEALLSGLSHAVPHGSSVTVPDPERPEGPPLTLPVDPVLTLPENAQAMFERYKKGKRGIVLIEARLSATRSRKEAWLALSRRAEAVRSTAELDRLRDDMAGLGLVHPERPRRSDRPQPREAPTRVRRHTTPDGFVVLVGRSGADNDALTFKIASPEDFWLHAAGSPGAHVVVRNPQRARVLPERTLRAAAEIAAHYSGAKEEGKVEVHYTQRKHVHKRKGMPPGQVLLRRFRSILVSPRLPVSLAEDV